MTSRHGRLFIGGLSLALLLAITPPAGAIYGLGDAAMIANHIVPLVLRLEQAEQARSDPSEDPEAQAPPEPSDDDAHDPSDQ